MVQYRYQCGESGTRDLVYKDMEGLCAEDAVFGRQTTYTITSQKEHDIVQIYQIQHLQHTIPPCLCKRDLVPHLHHTNVCTVPYYTVIPRLTKIIRFGITFVSRNLRQPKRNFRQVSIENRLIRSGCCPLFKDKFYKIVKSTL